MRRSARWGRPDLPSVKRCARDFSDPFSEYWEIFVPGIPGLVKVKLTASTVRKWRVDPPVQRGLVAQQWDVHVRGLEPGRQATVWNQETGAILVRAFADRTGRLDLSLVLHNHEQASALTMGWTSARSSPRAKCGGFHPLPRTKLTMQRWKWRCAKPF